MDKKEQGIERMSGHARAVHLELISLAGRKESEEHPHPPLLSTGTAPRVLLAPLLPSLCIQVVVIVCRRSRGKCAGRGRRGRAPTGRGGGSAACLVREAELAAKAA